MRIDRALFFLRLVKSRTLAQSLIETGRVRLDGHHVIKASEEIKVGSVLSLPLHGAVRIIRLTALPIRRGPPAEARACYEEISENVSQQASSD